METIKEFQGKYRFLSNFYPALLRYEGQYYESVEHAYQAAKTLDPEQRLKFTSGVGLKPGEAKRMGRRITIRADWEQVKVSVMRDLLKRKFSIGSLRERLLATGSSELQEGNTWGDRFWGICRGSGQNVLGKLLMEVREELRVPNES